MPRQFGGYIVFGWKMTSFLSLSARVIPGKPGMYDQ